MAKFLLLPTDLIDQTLELCPESPSGLRWKSRVSRNVKIGSVAGSRNTRGYWRVQLGKKTYLAHRVIFYLQTGQDPRELLIDHVNGLEDNFSIRLATPTQNQWNKQKIKPCSSRYKGVVCTSQHKSKPWKATINIGGKNKMIGYFETECAAAKAYDEMAIAHFGEYALLNFQD